MKRIEKTCTIYQAFDGTEFTNITDCEAYERQKAKEAKVNLRHFEIKFPLQDHFASCHAYMVNSENEFEMLKAYIMSEYDETLDDYLDYNGNGWYVVCGSESGYADLYKLSDIIRELNATLNEIASKISDL